MGKKYTTDKIFMENGSLDINSSHDGSDLTVLSISSSGQTTFNNGQITLGGTGRIQGVDTVDADTDAANKAYVDAAVSGGGGGNFLPLSGGTLTGPLAGTSATFTGDINIGTTDNIIKQGDNDQLDIFADSGFEVLSGDGIKLTISDVVEFTGTSTIGFGSTNLATFDAFNLTAGRNYTLPNEAGTIALVGNIPTNNNQLTNGAGYTGDQDLSGYLLNTTDTFTGSLTINGDIRGAGQQLVLNAGESYNYATGQTDEYVYINAEQGLEVNSTPDNWSSGWAGRNTTKINDLNGNSTFANDITVSGGDITLGGTGRIQGVDTVTDSTDAANKAYVDTLAATKTPLNDIRSLGVRSFTNGTSPNITTAQVMAEIEGDGGFDSFSSVFKTSWSYAGNYNLTDAGDFTETAGSSWLTWTDNSDDSARGNITTLAIAPNSGGSAGGVFIYNDQGAGYSPGWRQVWTSTTDGAGSGLDADLLDGQQGSYYASAASLGNGQIDGRTSGLGLSGSMDATANQSGNTTFTVTSNAVTAATANTIAYRDGSADLNVRLLRANYGNQSTIGGAMAFRVNNGSDNYLRYCSSPSAIRTFLGAGTGDITGVTAGTGMTGGGTSGTVALNVIGGSGITANANDIAVDSTVVRTSGDQNITGNKVFMGTTSTSYNSAPVELYSSGSGFGATPPRIGFHWAGVVASQISIEAGGEIAIRDNPGTGYEDLKARMFRATSGVSYFAGGLATSDTQSRNKLGVWSSNSTYTIGMMNGYGYGGLGGNSTGTDYAMSFQMSSAANRGWWWGDTSHNNLQGAMSLTTTGKAVIATSLSIGYGESTRTAATEKLEVNGNVKAQGLKLMSGTTVYLNTGSYSSNAYIYGYATGSTIYFGQPATWTQNIQVQGTATATNFILSSDKTLKNKIKEIDTNHIDVNWKNFELKSEPGVKRAGVIAQELEEKHPEFVRTDDEGIKSVAYIDLLITKIAELEARLEKLEK